MGPFRGFREHGNKSIYFRGTMMNKGLKMRGIGTQRQFWGTGNIGKEDFDLGQQGNKAIYFRGTWE